MKIIKAYQTDGGSIFEIAEEALKVETRAKFRQECIHFDDKEWDTFWDRRDKVLAILKVEIPLACCELCKNSFFSDTMHSYHDGKICNTCKDKSEVEE